MSKAKAPYRKVVKCAFVSKNPVGPPEWWSVNLTLECGHVVRRPWKENPQKRALCPQCLQEREEGKTA
jgi:hypothetical protein